MKSTGEMFDAMDTAQFHAEVYRVPGPPHPKHQPVEWTVWQCVADFWADEIDRLILGGAK